METVLLSCLVLLGLYSGSRLLLNVKSVEICVLNDRLSVHECTLSEEKTRRESLVWTRAGWNQVRLSNQRSLHPCRYVCSLAPAYRISHLSSRHLYGKT